MFQRTFIEIYTSYAHKKAINILSFNNPLDGD